jgi:hypothetical protein
MTLMTLGTVIDLPDAEFSGFDYPNNAQLVPLLSDGASERNAVLQQSGLTMRQATLATTLDTADAITLRGYYESREAVDFVDHDGATTSVRLLEFSRSMVTAGLWAVMLTMIEIADPVPLGS